MYYDNQKAGKGQKNGGDYQGYYSMFIGLQKEKNRKNNQRK
jgi:hypothetical protein